MKEICLLYKGDNIKKLSYIMGINKNLKEENSKVFDQKFIVVEDGEDDIQIVRNYNPYFVCQNNNINKLKNNGFDIISSCNNKIIFYKTNGMKYCVGPLESLKEIADKFGVSEEYIISTNNLLTNKLFIGQVLVI